MSGRPAFRPPGGGRGSRGRGRGGGRHGVSGQQQQQSHSGGQNGSYGSGSSTPDISQGMQQLNLGQSTGSSRGRVSPGSYGQQGYAQQQQSTGSLGGSYSYPGQPGPGMNTAAQIQHQLRNTAQLQQTGLEPAEFEMFYPQPDVYLPPDTQKASQTFFMSPQLRQELIQRHLTTVATSTVSGNDGGKNILPQNVDNYHTLLRLSLSPAIKRQQSTSGIHSHLNQLNSSGLIPEGGSGQHGIFGYPTSTYKAFSHVDGLTYCVRRIEYFRLLKERSMQAIEKWRRFSHSGIVNLRECFTTRDFGDFSVCFVYDYHPMARNVLAHHGLDPRYGGSGASQMVSESILWSYVIQLTSALRMIHAQGLACHVLDGSKVLITGKNRLRIGSVGVVDLLNYDALQKPGVLQKCQQADYQALGVLLLQLASGSIAASQPHTWETTLRKLEKRLSVDMQRLLGYLLYDLESSSGEGEDTEPMRKSIVDIMPLIGTRFYTFQDCTNLYVDVLESDLSKELQNGRLFRLLVKLNMVVERSAYNMDPQWSETGDRYMLKLFRDFVFHEQNEKGEVVLNLAHIVHHLNKLDTGYGERICMMSRDEQTVVFITYRELKHALETAMAELQAHSGPPNFLFIQ
eukprot:Clim_evm39s134 gene=Clim_evmTU39s134